MASRPWCIIHQLPGVGTLPQDAMDGLRRAHYGNGARNAFLYKELNRILSALQEMGSQNITRKGAALGTLTALAGHLSSTSRACGHAAVPARIAGVETWVLAPEDMLLHLCLHACGQHGPR
jgi:hypothetical protein